MRKLVLSLCVIAASGAYVAKQAAMRPIEANAAPSDGLDLSGAVSPAGPPPADISGLFSPAPAASTQPAAPAPAATANPQRADPAPGPAPVLPPLPQSAPEPPTTFAAQPAPEPPPPPARQFAAAGYRDGDYVGPSADAYYGYVQVLAHVKAGKLTSIEVLDYPADRRTSYRISNYALPRLQQEVVRAQGTNVNIISGATLTSLAYLQSLGTALRQAQ